MSQTLFSFVIVLVPFLFSSNQITKSKPNRSINCAKKKNTGIAVGTITMLHACQRRSERLALVARAPARRAFSSSLPVLVVVSTVHSATSSLRIVAPLSSNTSTPSTFFTCLHTFLILLYTTRSTTPASPSLLLRSNCSKKAGEVSGHLASIPPLLIPSTSQFIYPQTGTSMQFSILSTSANINVKILKTSLGLPSYIQLIELWQKQEPVEMPPKSIKAEPAFALICYLCPKTPQFSDLSHLLTHISSKSHLSHRFKIQLKSKTELAARVQLDNFDDWYNTNGLDTLLSDRMHTKENKKATKQKPSGQVRFSKTS